MAYMETYPGLIGRFPLRPSTVVQGGKIIPTLCLEHAPGGIQVVPTLFSSNCAEFSKSTPIFGGRIVPLALTFRMLHA